MISIFCKLVHVMCALLYPLSPSLNSTYLLLYSYHSIK